MPSLARKGSSFPRSQIRDRGHPHPEVMATVKRPLNECENTLAQECGDGGDDGLLFVFAEFGEDGQG